MTCKLMAAAAARAALCALWLCVPALAAGTEGPRAPRERDIRRAERILAKLRRLGAAREDAAEFRSLTRKLYPGLFVAVAELGQSDLKTDLDTAVFLYEEAGRTWDEAGARAADCARERPDTFTPLCRELRGGTMRQLLLSKARLHAAWAEAAVRVHKGEGDAGTSRALAEMRAARENDAAIAARVVEALKPLEGVVKLPQTYADYQEHGALSRVGPERLDAEFAGALARAGALLGWMARSPTFYALRGAWRSYADGLFWYRRVQRARSLVVAAEAFEPDPQRDLGRDPEQAGYAAAVNWRTAVKFTRLAERSLSPKD